MFAGILSSLSARRAWIEIEAPTEQANTYAVALRKESVDRNSIEPANIRVSTTSLSARRAWIEIRLVDMSAAWNRVALRKESVDRNPGSADRNNCILCRSPQGERG